ncbi:MAG: YesL family protein [Lachnotalea sp.]
MGSIFSLDGKFFTIMSKVADLIILNIVYCLCCVPIITIGPATTALYYVTLKMVKDEESYIIKSFFKSFKENFKQAVGIWIVLLATLGIIVGDIYIMLKWETKYKVIFIVIFIFLLLMWFFVTIYIFPLLATFDNTVKQTFKNSFLMSIRHLPMTAVLFLLTAVSTLLVGFVVQLMPFWFLIGFALLAFINSFILRKIFKAYMPPEEDEGNEFKGIDES